MLVLFQGGWGEIPAGVNVFPGKGLCTSQLLSPLPRIQGDTHYSSPFCVLDASCMRGGTHLLVPCLEEKELTLHKRGLDMSEALPCPGKDTSTPGCRLGALYWACVHNDPTQLQAILDGGVSPEEATQVDNNGRVRCPGFPGQLGASLHPHHTVLAWLPERGSGAIPPAVLRRKGMVEGGSLQGLGKTLGRCGFRGHKGPWGGSGGKQGI